MTITLPLWQHLGELFAGLEEPVANLQANRLYYEAELARHDRIVDDACSVGSDDDGEPEAVRNVDETTVEAELAVADAELKATSQ